MCSSLCSLIYSPLESAKATLYCVAEGATHLSARVGAILTGKTVLDLTFLGVGAAYCIYGAAAGVPDIGSFTILGVVYAIVQTYLWVNTALEAHNTFIQNWSWTALVPILATAYLATSPGVALVSLVSLVVLSTMGVFTQIRIGAYIYIGNERNLSVLQPTPMDAAVHT